jgi:hypothetical protein
MRFMRLLWAVVHGLERTSKQMHGRVGVTGPQRLVLRVVGLNPGLSAGDLATILTHGPALRALETRAQQFQARSQALQGDMECTQALTLRDFDAQVRPLIRTAMEQRSANVVVDSSNALIFQPDADITNTVIQQLDQNQATRVANVSRRPLSQCQTQQPAQ